MDYLSYLVYTVRISYRSNKTNFLEYLKIEWRAVSLIDAEL